MKHRPGFALYGTIFGASLVLLAAIIFLISRWANEMVYFRELSRQRTVGATEVILCEGPNKVSCPKGQVCENKKASKDSFGVCI